MVLPECRHKLKPQNFLLKGWEATLQNFEPAKTFPLYGILYTGNVVDCRQFIDHGCLGYLIVALSCQAEEVRTAAGHALTRFSQHLDGSRFREKAQVQ